MPDIQCLPVTMQSKVHPHIIHVLATKNPLTTVDERCIHPYYPFTSFGLVSNVIDPTTMTLHSTICDLMNAC